MVQALVSGKGPLADALAEALATVGWPVRHGLPGGDETLLAVVLPPRDEPGLIARLSELVGAMAARLPPPAPDASGELRAAGQVLLVLDRAAQVPGVLLADAAAAQAAVQRWMADAALASAPRLRVNALACDPALQAADLVPVVGWLTAAHAVTGQLLALGPGPRLAAPWRGDAAAQVHFD